MTDEERRLCDCPEPCGCYAEGYAAGKDKAFFEMEMALQDDTHAAGCGCQPCPDQASRAGYGDAGRHFGERWGAMTTGTESAHVQTVSRETVPHSRVMGGTFEHSFNLPRPANPGPSAHWIRQVGKPGLRDCPQLSDAAQLSGTDSPQSRRALPNAMQSKPSAR